MEEKTEDIPPETSDKTETTQEIVEEFIDDFGQELLDRMDAIDRRIDELDRRTTRGIDEPGTIPETETEIHPENNQPETRPTPTHIWFRRVKRD